MSSVQKIGREIARLIDQEVSNYGCVEQLGVSAKHICQLAKIHSSTTISLQYGSDPQVKTTTKMHRALENLGMSFCKVGDHL